MYLHIHCVFHVRLHFGELFNNDKDELDEAVSFLHLQGTFMPANSCCTMCIYTYICTDVHACMHVNTHKHTTYNIHISMQGRCSTLTTTL